MAKNTTYISTIKLDFRFLKKACGEKCYTTAQYNLRFQSVRVGEGRRRVMRKTNHISANQYKRLTKNAPPTTYEINGISIPPSYYTFSDNLNKNGR